MMNQLTLSPSQWTLLAVALLWTLAWKGVALWKAARKNDRWWFIVMVLPINTIGILEILYIFFFNKRKSLENNRESVSRE